MVLKLKIWGQQQWLLPTIPTRPMLIYLMGHIRGHEFQPRDIHQKKKNFNHVSPQGLNIANLSGIFFFYALLSGILIVVLVLENIF